MDWLRPNGSSGKGDSGRYLRQRRADGGPAVNFRTIETQRIRGMEFEEQANLIISMLTRYNVQHIGIDGSGIGEAVYQIVKKHFPAAVCYQFSLTSKRMLVLKMQQLVRGGRWEYDRGEYDLITAFSSVRKGGYARRPYRHDTDRSRGVSHGDVARATMLATINEPLGQEGGSGMTVTEY